MDNQWGNWFNFLPCLFSKMATTRTILKFPVKLCSSHYKGMSTIIWQLSKNLPFLIYTSKLLFFSSQTALTSSNVQIIIFLATLFPGDHSFPITSIFSVIELLHSVITLSYSFLSNLANSPCGWTFCLSLGNRH